MLLSFIDDNIDRSPLAVSFVAERYSSLIIFAVFDLRLILSMSATRVNTVGSEFRTILTRIREVKETLEQTDNVELARQLQEVNDSLRILEGNQSEFADAVFKVLQNIESKMAEGFKMMEAKVAELDAKMRPSCEVAPCTPSPTSSGKKRKIARHPDLSVSEAYSQLNSTLNCLMFFIKFDHFDVLKKRGFGSPSFSRNFKLRAASSNFSHLGVRVR